MWWCEKYVAERKFLRGSYSALIIKMVGDLKMKQEKWGKKCVMECQLLKDFS